MPQKVDDIYRALKRENPSMPDDRAWAIAWSTYKKMKEDTDYSKGSNQGNPIQVELGQGCREELEEELRNKLAWSMYKKSWDELDDRARQTIITLMKTLPRKEKFEVTDELAKSLAQYVGIPADITNDDLLEEFRMGLEVEQEHEDVTGGDPKITAKIVKAHLDEDPKYYSKLLSLGLEKFREQATTYQGDTFTYNGSRIEVWSDAQGRWSFMVDNLQGGGGFMSKADAIAAAKAFVDKPKETIYFEAGIDGVGVINPSKL